MTARALTAVDAAYAAGERVIDNPHEYAAALVDAHARDEQALPGPYTDLVRTLLEYEREHDRAEQQAFQLEEKRIALEFAVLAILRRVIEEGAATELLDQAPAHRVWLEVELLDTRRRWVALHRLHRRWLVRRTFDRLGDINVQAALLAKPGDRDW